jgi:sarcosine/dimethylglycine N-methyltransferase
VRFRYSFSDGDEYTLNLFPLRKNYVRRLLKEAGFERVRTYGDFQETYHENDPDFFIHIAEKSALKASHWKRVARTEDVPDVRDITEAYYDSDDADAFYATIWGGEDLHIGIYDDTTDIREASAETVDRMAAMLDGLDDHAQVLDIGAGYGGSARRIAKQHGARVRCLNISETQNDTNRH